MAVQVIDSPLRCPRDSKRMVVHLGQGDADGGLEMVHECWHCGYTELEQRKPRTLGETGAQRLMRLRLQGAEAADAHP